MLLIIRIIIWSKWSNNYGKLIPCCDVCYDFRIKICSVRFHYYLFCSRREFMLFVCINPYWRQTQFPSWMMLDQQPVFRAEYSLSPPNVCWIIVAQSLVFCFFCFCRPSFVYFFIFYLSLCCLSFDLRCLQTYFPKAELLLHNLLYSQNAQLIYIFISKKDTKIGFCVKYKMRIYYIGHTKL
jgi:hypothetical protein